MSNSPDNHIRLACQACQRKKIKCDRNFPCTQCVRSNLHCVASSRKPRARHSGKRAVDSELRNRISKLENLVENLSGDVALATEGPSMNGAGQVAETKGAASPAVRKYIGSQFWSTLTGEPSPQASAVLFDAFCSNVDRISKIYHTPSLQAFMIEGKPYLGHDPSTPGNNAVKAAIWFAASNTLSEDECQMMFGKSRYAQSQIFRKMVDIALAQADLFTTSDLATLQALTTYTITSRYIDSSRRAWTMAAILVRIARASGLHSEAIPRTPFITELRRRLWHSIRFTDVFVSWDRGSSDLLIDSAPSETPRPLNIEDTDINESSETLPPEREGLTSMSWAVISVDSASSMLRFSARSESKPGGGDTWEDRLAAANEFARHINDKYLRHIDPTDPYHRFVKHVCGSMIASHRLRAVRPMRKHPLSTAPRVDSPYVLQLALDSIRASEDTYTDAATKPFQWLAWVPWHPLAVALAGLCAIRDTELANEAWLAVDKAYLRLRGVIADSQSGMLWRPIEKLYKTATAFREHREGSAEISPPSHQQPLQLPLHPSNTIPTSPYPIINPFYPSPAFPPNNAAAAAHSLSNNTTTFPPFDPNTTNPMNLDLTNPTALSDLDFSNSNLNWWMEFQNIFEDMSTPAPELNVGNIAWAGGGGPSAGGVAGAWGVPQNPM
ncbi:hypothetical protein BDY17DRAFT_251388 [Neohortaea acidophila]|uniref:Zn(2)-C6 fungal-type domain-containing protein n=1 Tax=Neohortaea acidophila TaxID=245834 RepID=A0A6A6PQQ6_9PEZI|nr:uncharacterized protein BDY17DRAFT_251388 [Neohortaea acidophila]KAF2482430.1 hypothetical protein BDY17DRAFT_251388 [Neohortaea acidophila]